MFSFGSWWKDLEFRIYTSRKLRKIVIVIVIVFGPFYIGVQHEVLTCLIICTVRRCCKNMQKLRNIIISKCMVDKKSKLLRNMCSAYRRRRYPKISIRRYVYNLHFSTKLRKPLVYFLE